MSFNRMSAVTGVMREGPQPPAGGSSAPSGFRRRILIEPSPGQVAAELEDDWHRMVVTLAHTAGVVTEVSSEMKRRPWTTCPGAMAQLKATFEGQALAGFTRRGEKTLNCTHLYDLAVFAAAHADGLAATAYEVFVSDAVDGRRSGRLWRNGVLALDWTMQDARLTSPPELAGRGMGELGDWIAEQDEATAEAARILRWSAILQLGRAMDIPAGLSATAFPSGACYTFQPEMAKIGLRVENASEDFSRSQIGPMADRSAAFAGRQRGGGGHTAAR